MTYYYKIYYTLKYLNRFVLTCFIILILINYFITSMEGVCECVYVCVLVGGGGGGGVAGGRKEQMSGYFLKNFFFIFCVLKVIKR